MIFAQSILILIKDTAQIEELKNTKKKCKIFGHKVGSLDYNWTIADLCPKCIFTYLLDVTSYYLLYYLLYIVHINQCPDPSFGKWQWIIGTFRWVSSSRMSVQVSECPTPKIEWNPEILQTATEFKGI